MRSNRRVWGGKLTALQLDTDELRIVQVAGPRRRLRLRTAAASRAQASQQRS